MTTSILLLGCFVTMFITYVIYGPYPDSKRSKIVFFGILAALILWFGVEAYMHGGVGVCALLEKVTLKT